MDLDETLLEQALGALGDVLESRGLRYELAVVGGSALILIGLSLRPTKDLDVVALVEGRRYEKVDALPGPLVDAVEDIAATFGLAPDWLNPGPSSLLELGLPHGFADRTEKRTIGGLVLHVASRRDQIFFKLYAAVDLGPDSKHVDDLRRLEPSQDELLEAARWAKTHDPSPGFHSQIIGALDYLGVEDADNRL